VPEIRLITIWFGANDACLPSTPQHVPLKRFVENLERWVEMLQSPASQYYSPNTRIVLISPPPVNTYQRAADLASREVPRLLDRDFETTRKYAEAVEQVAREKKVGFTDVWNVLWEASGENERALSKYLYDGLHLNKEGYKVWAIISFFSRIFCCFFWS
jgi:lysophospholipase L1-like esterase